MLTIINSLADALFSTELEDEKANILNFLDAIQSVPFDQFAHLNDDFEVDQLAICILDGDVVSIVVQHGLDKEAVKSLTNYYTAAKAVRVYYTDRNNFPSGDDWSVEGLSFIQADCTDQGLAGKYKAEQTDTTVTLRYGTGVYVGTRLEDLKNFSIIASGEYDDSVMPVLQLAQQYCADDALGLLVQCQSNSWVKPMLDLGFEANRWILKAEFNRL